MWRSSPNKFKSWFVAAAAFCIGAISIDYLCTRLVINGTAMSEPTRIAHLIHEDGSEIPIFGNSQAREDFVSEILGDDVFNYGMDGISLDVVDALLQIECKKHKVTPIIVVLGHTALRTVGAPSKYPPFVRQPEIRHMLERLGVMEWRYWVPGLRYFGYYDWYLKDYLAEHTFRAKKTVRGHTVELYQPFDRQSLDEAIKARLRSGFGFDSIPAQDRLLFDRIRSTPQRTFIIVYPPLHSACFANFQNQEGFARHLDKLRSFSNVVVLDWGRMELADDCFFDTIHLNEKGAREVSQRLADWLRTIRAAGIPLTNNSGFFEVHSG
jgi:hypothetical protein